MKTFLRHLQAKRPQTLYKSLFTCSAAATTATLAPPLKLVHTLSTALGADQFWLRADPEMVAIVLMGNAGTKVNKGKNKDGHRPTATIKLGRYAMAVELLRGLEIATRPGKFDTRVVSFLEKLEGRVAMLLESEVCLTVQQQWLI